MSKENALGVSVIMQKSLVTQGRWTVPSWEAVGVIPHESGSREQRGEPLRDDGKLQQFLWTGFPLRLHKDSAESYWYNLVGNQPSLYVLCHEEPDGSVSPFAVTADHDEASAGMEGDDRVYATPIPPEIYRSLEAFVVRHFQPREKKIRRRRRWQGGEDA